MGIFANVSGESQIDKIKNYGTLQSIGGNSSPINLSGRGFSETKGVTDDKNIDTASMDCKLYGSTNAGLSYEELKQIEIDEINKHIYDLAHQRNPVILANDDPFVLAKNDENLLKKRIKLRGEHNIETFKQNYNYLLVDKDGNENYIYANNKITNPPAGMGGDVGLIVKTENGSTTVSNCVNNGEIYSCGGTAENRIEVKINSSAVSSGGQGGSAGGLIGETLDQVTIIDCENNGSVSANGGAIMDNLPTNVNEVFAPIGGDAGCAGGFIGCADENGESYKVTFKGKCTNNGKIEAISGDAYNISGRRVGAVGIRSTIAYGKSSADYLPYNQVGNMDKKSSGFGGNGGSAGGFIGESYAEVELSASGTNNGKINSAGTFGGNKKDDESDDYVFGGSGGIAGGLIGYAADKVYIKGETKNNGPVLADGASGKKASGETASDDSIKGGGAGVAGGIVGLASSDVFIESKTINSGKISAVASGKLVEGGKAGDGGIAGAAVGKAKSKDESQVKVNLNNFINESSSEIVSGGSSGAKSGLVGEVKGDITVSNTINKGIIRAIGSDGGGGFGSGEAGFVSGAGGNINITNCQNVGKISAEEGGQAGFITEIPRGAVANIKNSSNIGEVSATKGYAGGLICTNLGTVNIDNTYVASNINAGENGLAGQLIANADLSKNISINNLYLKSGGAKIFGNQDITEFTPVTIKEEEDMKSNGFAESMNQNAITVNTSMGGIPNAISYCGWVLGNETYDNYLMLLPGESPDVAEEIVSMGAQGNEEESQDLINLKNMSTPACPHNLPDEDGTNASEEWSSCPGTLDEPCIIKSAADFKNISSNDNKVYKFMCNIDMSLLDTVKNGGTINEQIVHYSGLDNFKGTILGNGAIIRNLSGSFINTVNGATIKDLLFDSSCVIEGDGDLGVIKNATGNCTFINVESRTDIKSFSGGNVGFILKTEGNGTVSLSNCVNQGRIFTIGAQSKLEKMVSGNAGGLIGNAGTKVCLLNCKNEGKISTYGVVKSDSSGVDAVFTKCATAGNAGNAGGVIGNATGNNKTVEALGRCENMGTVSAKGGEGGNPSYELNIYRLVDENDQPLTDDSGYKLYCINGMVLRVDPNDDDPDQSFLANYYRDKDSSPVYINDKGTLKQTAMPVYFRFYSRKCKHNVIIPPLSYNPPVKNSEAFATTDETILIGGRELALKDGRFQSNVFARSVGEHYYSNNYSHYETSMLPSLYKTRFTIDPSIVRVKVKGDSTSKYLLHSHNINCTGRPFVTSNNPSGSGIGCDVVHIDEEGKLYADFDRTKELCFSPINTITTTTDLGGGRTESVTKDADGISTAESYTDDDSGAVITTTTEGNVTTITETTTIDRPPNITETTTKLISKSTTTENEDGTKTVSTIEYNYADNNNPHQLTETRYDSDENQIGESSTSECGGEGIITTTIIDKYNNKITEIQKKELWEYQWVMWKNSSSSWQRCTPINMETTQEGGKTISTVTDGVVTKTTTVDGNTTTTEFSHAYEGLPIKIGKNCHELEFCVPNKIYKKELFKTIKSGALGGDGGNGGCAGAFIGNADVPVTLNDFFSDADKVDASGGTGGISSEEEETEKSSKDGNGGYAGVIGKASQKVELSNVQCKNCNISAFGVDDNKIGLNGAAGLIGSSESSSEVSIKNSLITGRISAELGYAGLIGKGGPSTTIKNSYASCDVSANCKGKIFGSLDSQFLNQLTVEKLFFNSEKYEGFKLVGNQDDASINIVGGAVIDKTTSDMQKREFMNELNENASNDDGSEGWIIHNTEDGFPDLFYNNIDPSKMSGSTV